MPPLPKKVVVDASLIVDLYAAPTEERASIAEEVDTFPPIKLIPEEVICWDDSQNKRIEKYVNIYVLHKLKLSSYT